MAHQHNYFWKVKDFEIFELYFFALVLLLLVC